MTRRTEDGGRRQAIESRESRVENRSPVSGLRSLFRDTDGQALLETVIVFPILLMFVLVVIELSMLYNAKQLANHAAFCAARTASVYGIDSTAKTHFAAAMIMSALAPTNNSDAVNILRAYGLTDPDRTIAAICSIPGFQGDRACVNTRLAESSPVVLGTGAARDDS